MMDERMKWASIGYLAEKTGLVWQVELRRQFFDVDILCMCGDLRLSAGNVTFVNADSELAILESMIPHLDMVVATFERLTRGAHDG